MCEITNTDLAWYGNVIFRNVLVYSVLIDFAFVGCLESGYYGPNCSIPCPDPHCRYCHLETGVCQGCEAGYEGHHCELGLFVCLFVRDFTSHSNIFHLYEDVHITSEGFQIF